MTAKKSGASPDKRRKYDEVFKAEALRLATESRSTQAAARQLGISPKLLYRWQQAQLVAEVGSVEVAATRKYAPCARPTSGWRRSSTF
ncbi:transposase [Hymenobacter glaciei]